MTPPMEAVRPIETQAERSPLAKARLQRKLTVEEAARRADLTPDQVEWLEEGRVYRFRSADDALLALLLYATALGIDHREARTLAGLPVAPAPARAPVTRWIGGAAAALGLALALAITLFPGINLGDESPAGERRPAQNLPAPWTIAVDVLNGSGDRNYTGRVASRIGALGYRIERVARASRFDYRQTAVYYERGGEAVARRLAEQLGVLARPLPGGKNPRRLVVIVGPARGPG